MRWLIIPFLILKEMAVYVIPTCSIIIHIIRIINVNFSLVESEPLDKMTIECLGVDVDLIKENVG